MGKMCATAAGVPLALSSFDDVETGSIVSISCGITLIM